MTWLAIKKCSLLWLSINDKGGKVCIISYKEKTLGWNILFCDVLLMAKNISDSLKQIRQSWI
jgi:hypothetical protein